MLKRFAQISIIFSVNLLFVSTGLGSDSYYYDSGRVSTPPPHLEFKEAPRFDLNFSKKSPYIFANYTATYRFLPGTHQTILNPNASPSSVIFSTKEALPRSAHGFEIGFGKKLTKRIDLQLAYIQQFRETHNGFINAVNGPKGLSVISLSMKGASLNLGYIFNPEDQLQVMPQIGIVAEDFRESVTFAGASYTPPDLTEVNPSTGLELVYQFTEDFAFRFGAQYTFAITSKIANGALTGFAGFSYIV